MDWFERLTGFPEAGYGETQARLRVEDDRLIREGTCESFAVGTLTLPSVAELRAVAAVRHSGRLRRSIVEGDVRAMHALPENRGALFQVASQFNMLEMVGPDVTPEDGVAGYAHDRTQGPACAMAAGAATIYRNYLVPVAGEIGQTAGRQLDGLAELGNALAQRLGTDRGSLWAMRNGYALPTRGGLAAIAKSLNGADEGVLDDLRGRLRLGLHMDVEVTEEAVPRPLVSQIFCSALPVAYTRLPTELWAPFARLVLEAAYEGTLLAGVLNAARPLKVHTQTLNRSTGSDCDLVAIEEVAGRVRSNNNLQAMLSIQDERKGGKPNLIITFDKSGARVQPRPEAFVIGCGAGVGYDGRWQLRAR